MKVKKKKKSFVLLKMKKRLLLASLVASAAARSQPQSIQNDVTSSLALNNQALNTPSSSSYIPSTNAFPVVPTSNFYTNTYTLHPEFENPAYNFEPPLQNDQHYRENYFFANAAVPVLTISSLLSSAYLARQGVGLVNRTAQTIHQGINTAQQGLQAVQGVVSNVQESAARVIAQNENNVRHITENVRQITHNVQATTQQVQNDLQKIKKGVKKAKIAVIATTAGALTLGAITSGLAISNHIKRKNMLKKLQRQANK